VRGPGPEYDTLPVRYHEDDALAKLALHCPHKLPEPKWTDPHTKANILLQCHFARRKLPAGHPPAYPCRVTQEMHGMVRRKDRHNDWPNERPGDVRDMEDDRKVVLERAIPLVQVCPLPPICKKGRP
jgi:hypothetical protein